MRSNKKIRTIFVFADVIMVYRHATCRKYKYAHKSHANLVLAALQFDHEIREGRWDDEINIFSDKPALKPTYKANIKAYD